MSDATPTQLNIEAARSVLDSRTRITVETARAAAVLVAVIDDGGPPRIILTRRAAKLSRHAGQVALPGGRIDDIDEGPLGAALREAREEIGLEPASVEIIGCLDDILRESTGLTPVLACVRRTPELAPNPDEVDAIFEIPLDALRSPTQWSVPFSIERLGQQWPVFCFDWRGELIWGLTAYVLLLALEALGGAPMTLPAPYDRGAACGLGVQAAEAGARREAV